MRYASIKQGQKLHWSPRDVEFSKYPTIQYGWPIMSVQTTTNGWTSNWKWIDYPRNHTSVSTNLKCSWTLPAKSGSWHQESGERSNKQYGDYVQLPPFHGPHVFDVIWGFGRAFVEKNGRSTNKHPSLRLYFYNILDLCSSPTSFNMCITLYDLIYPH